MTSRTTKEPLPKSTPRAPVDDPSSSRSGLRGLSFDEGEQQLAPVDATLVAPNFGARLTGANYAKIYDAYGKFLKASTRKQAGMLAGLVQSIESWLGVHDGSQKHDKDRLPGVKQLLQQLKARQSGGGGGGEVEQVGDTTVDIPKDEGPKEDPKVEPPKDVPPPPKDEVPPPPKDVPPPPKDEVPPPPKDVPPPPKDEVPPPPKDEVPPPPKDEVPPPPKDVPPTPEDPIVAKLADAKVELTDKELGGLSYAQVINYLDTRERALVEKLRTNDKFITHAESLGVEQFANIVCRILLRVPDSVINKGGSSAEAIRILSSQLRDAEVCKNLLKNEAFVVIIPKNKVMTEFAEFSQWAGTYTFDGRPWDVTRGMGATKTSRNTAITEENLLGEDVDKSAAQRKGWWSKEWMEHSKKNGTTEPNESGKTGPKSGDQGTRTFDPQNYCSGYSTANHEFFHTIHALGLNKTDHAKIQSEYDDKKKTPAATEWADGPRLNKDDTTTLKDNYSSSTVFEYWAQTGCAFQGTNTGTDAYTQRPRNNGRSWVDTNEPELAKILSKVCSDSELKNINPRDAKTKKDEAPKTETTPGTKGGVTPGVTPGVSPQGEQPKKTTPTPDVTPDVGGTKVGDSIGVIGSKN